MKRDFHHTAGRYALALALCLAGTALAAGEPKDMVPDVIGYAAGGFADRITLSPGADPAHQMAVAFRTSQAQSETIAEIGPALDGPGIAAQAKPVSGTTAGVVAGGLYHHVVFSGLQPDTAYVYRVKGAAGWSEWFQFRTAAAGFKPFQFVYFGDTQNNILPIASRVIRQAFRSGPALALHAGDLVDQRNEIAADNAWGEWHAAGSYNYAIVPQAPVPGNHEYTETKLAGGGDKKGDIGPWWSASFALPSNGADPVKSTTYYVDYQGVRFVMLDGTAAIERGALKAEVDWLDGVLTASKARWTVVMFHQPLFMCARSDDLADWKAAMVPVLEKHGVALALSGHDHCYSRISDPTGRGKTGDLRGPVYLISVTGSKMYGLNEQAIKRADRVAEDTELYQVVSVEADRLHVEAHTATGRLYDSFDIVRGADGKKRLIEAEGLPPARTCKGASGPDGIACSTRTK